MERKRSDMERYRKKGGWREREEGERERRDREKDHQIKAAACSFPTLPRPYPFTVSLCVLQVTFLRDKKNPITHPWTTPHIR